MKQLLKYEERKTLGVKLISLGVTALLEIVFLISLFRRSAEGIGIAAVFLTMTAFASVMVVGLASVLILHRDMNTKQSYMLFMTPNSCNKILGAKVLENGLSILLAGAFFFALGALDITLLFAREGQVGELWEMLQNFLTSLDSRLRVDFPSLAALTANMLCGWFAMVMAAYLGEVISAALLYGRRYNGIVSFLLILALIIGISLLQNLAGKGISEIVPSLLVRGGVALACSGVMYLLTAQIMEQKLSV